MNDTVDADVVASIRASFNGQGLMTLLGAHLTDIHPGRVHIALAHRPEVSQQHGFFHAGAIGAIADSAGAYAATTLLAPRTELVAVEYKINFVAPAVGQRVEAVGTVLKSGRTLSITRLEVFSVDELQRKLAAVGQQTLMAV